LASKIDRVIDQLEETNRRVRELQFFLIRSGALSAINPVAGKVAGAIAAPAEVINEMAAEAYFNTVRSGAGLLDNPIPGGNTAIETFGSNPSASKVKKPRTTAQKKNDKMQSKAFQTANKALRTSVCTKAAKISAVAVARYPYSLPETPLARTLFLPIT